MNFFGNSRFIGVIFRKFMRIYGRYFYDLNGTTPYLGKVNDLFPQAAGPGLEPPSFRLVVNRAATKQSRSQ